MYENSFISQSIQSKVSSLSKLIKELFFTIVEPESFTPLAIQELSFWGKLSNVSIYPPNSFLLIMTGIEQGG